MVKLELFAKLVFFPANSQLTPSMLTYISKLLAFPAGYLPFAKAEGLG